MGIDIDWNLLGKFNPAQSYYGGRDDRDQQNALLRRDQRAEEETAYSRQRDIKTDARQATTDRQAAEDRARKISTEDRDTYAATLSTLRRLSKDVKTPEEWEAVKANPYTKQMLDPDFDLAGVTFEHLPQIRKAAPPGKLTEVTGGASVMNDLGENVFTAPKAPDPLEEERRALIEAQTAASRSQVPLRAAQAERARRPPAARSSGGGSAKLPTGFILD